MSTHSYALTEITRNVTDTSYLKKYLHKSKHYRKSPSKIGALWDLMMFIGVMMI